MKIKMEKLNLLLVSILLIGIVFAVGTSISDYNKTHIERIPSPSDVSPTQNSEIIYFKLTTDNEVEYNCNITEPDGIFDKGDIITGVEKCYPEFQGEEITNIHNSDGEYLQADGSWYNVDNPPSSAVDVEPD